MEKKTATNDCNSDYKAEDSTEDFHGTEECDGYAEIDGDLAVRYITTIEEESEEEQDEEDVTTSILSVTDYTNDRVNELKRGSYNSFGLLTNIYNNIFVISTFFFSLKGEDA